MFVRHMLIVMPGFQYDVFHDLMKNNPDIKVLEFGSRKKYSLKKNVNSILFRK
jgi:hypothetical protein